PVQQALAQLHRSKSNEWHHRRNRQIRRTVDHQLVEPEDPSDGDADEQMQSEERCAADDATDQDRRGQPRRRGVLVYKGGKELMQAAAQPAQTSSTKRATIVFGPTFGK